MIWKRVSQVAMEDGVTRYAVWKRIKAGKYPHVRKTAGGHYRIGFESQEDTVLYARVSSSKQASSLDRQVELLRERYPAARLYKDVGSGFNFKRRGLTTILERILRGDKLTIVATTQDRITRQGFPLLKLITDYHGCRFQFLEEDVPSESFSIETLIAYLTSFCNSQSGKRSSRRHKEN